MSSNYDISNNVTDNSGNDLNKNESNDHFYTIFNKSNITLLIWFLAIYFVAYFGLSFVFNKGNDPAAFQTKLSRTIDMIFVSILIVFLVISYTSYPEEKKQDLLEELTKKVGDYIDSPTSIFSVSLFLITFYLVAYLFRIPMADDKPLTVSFIESSAWIALVVIAFYDFFKYVLKISLKDAFLRLFDWNKLPDESPNVMGNLAVSKTSNVQPSIMMPVQQDEVFNISNNLYTYDDAQSICSSYGAKMATYDQIEEAYNKGAEWCNYGWSDGQMAFFPTQKASWDKLQKTTDHKNDCGRPGINGGFFENPYIKFGVNCYGKKPKPSDADLLKMKSKQDFVYPKNKKDLELDAKVKFWKDNADKLLKMNSFNEKKWSEY